MKKFIILLFLIADQNFSFAQNRNVVLENFSFGGHSFSMTRDDVIKAFGQPEIVYPKYDCGFFSDEWTGITYYQLKYSAFNYIGSDKEKFVLERVDFDKDGKIQLKYATKTLTGLTSKTELAEIFGEDPKKLFQKCVDKDAIILMTGNDDGVRFTFKDGRLSKFEYWTPC